MNEVLAGLVLAVCVALLLRMVLPARWRARLDARVQGLKARLKRRRPPAEPRRPMSEQEAERLAREAIRRARGEDGDARRSGRWDGNVFRLRGDKRPRKPH